MLVCHSACGVGVFGQVPFHTVFDWHESDCTDATGNETEAQRNATMKPECASGATDFTVAVFIRIEEVADLGLARVDPAA